MLVRRTLSTKFCRIQRQLVNQSINQQLKRIHLHQRLSGFAKSLAVVAIKFQALIYELAYNKSNDIAVGGVIAGDTTDVIIER